MKSFQVLLIIGVVLATTPSMPKSEQSLWNNQENMIVSLRTFSRQWGKRIYPVPGSSRWGVGVTPPGALNGF